jgi:hypothetical protein
MIQDLPFISIDLAQRLVPLVSTMDERGPIM